jgi:hypothetical protein
MATMTDLDELALAMPQATKEVSSDGRPAYLVHGKLFCCHRNRRADAVDSETGERLDDVLMLRVADLGAKELLLSDARGVYFTSRTSTAIPPCCSASRTSQASTATSWATWSPRPG